MSRSLSSNVFLLLLSTLHEWKIFWEEDCRNSLVKKIIYVMIRFFSLFLLAFGKLRAAGCKRFVLLTSDPNFGSFRKMLFVESR